MRETLRRLVREHGGYSAVLNELTTLAGAEIQPLEIGYTVVFEKASPLNQLFFKLDHARNSVINKCNCGVHNEEDGHHGPTCKARS